MEQLIIILIFLAISAVNWLAQRAEEKRAREALEEEARRGAATPDLPEEGTAPPHTARRRSAEEDELRKFFEALGLPVEEAKPEPPPPPKPAPPPAPRPAAATSPAAQSKAGPPPSTTATWTPQAKARAASPESALTKEEREALERIKSGKAGVISTQAASRRPAAFRTGRALIDETVALLKDPVSARKAVLLREILDRPAALRDTTPGGAVFPV